jgi:hypothetical protein
VLRDAFKAATCTSTSKTCNSMLKAQMLATALYVYFSSPSLGGNKINAPAPLGGIAIDLTNVCQMLAYQNTADPAADAGANWYGQVKATQVMAKDAFDAINNQVALQAP